MPGAPNIRSATVAPDGTRSLIVNRTDGRFGVYEQRYLVFPERSGIVVVPSASVTRRVRIESEGRVRMATAEVIAPEVRVEFEKQVE